MRMAPLALALVLPVATTIAAAQDAQQDHPIFKSVDRLREVVSSMRGLKFHSEVKVGINSPTQLREMLLKEFEEEEPAEKMLKDEKVFKRFGLLPADYDLRARMIDFMSENVAGYYDPEKKELFLVDQSQSEAMKKMGNMGGMQEAMDEMVMAHELHHALQDQHFDLTRWFELLASHDDRIQGYKSLTEGEAQIVGLKAFGPKIGMPQLGASQWNRMNEMALMMPGPEADKIRAIPPFLVENMMFPYTQGAEFVETFQRLKGWEAISAAFSDPPSSTEQVLHPEKYYGPQRDEPMELLLPDVSGHLGEGAEELRKNTLGEFNVTLLLRALGVKKPEAAKAAAGWDGDRYEAYETKDGRVVLLWVTTWDSEAEATEFEAIYRKALKAAPDRHLERRGTEVLLVDGASDEERPAIVRKGFEAVKYEARFQPLQGLTVPPPREDFVRAEAKAVAPSAAAAGSGLVHADVAGATFLPPSGWTIADEPLHQLQQLGSVFLKGPNGATTRLLRLPIPLAQAQEQLPVLLAQGVPDGEVRSQEKMRVLGRDAVWLDIKGTMPGEKAPSWIRILVFDQGLDSLAVGVSIPEGQPGQPQEVIEALLGQLWLDGTAAGAKTFTNGVVTFEEPAGFVAGQVRGQVVATLEHPGGAKVQVVRTGAQGGLDERARALEAQLPLLLEDFQLRSSGVVSRRGRPVHELDYVAAGRRTRQLTLDVDGGRWTVSCSAPVDAFNEHAPAFGRVLATFAVAGAPAAPPAQQAPEAPPQERKAY